jgi:hypothetical protein
VAEHRSHVLGPGHADTLVARVALAAARAAVGDPVGAKAVLLSALDDAEQSIGTLDLLTISLRADLGDCYAALDDLYLAHFELDRAAADCETVLGDDHPYTVELRTYVAEVVPDMETL